MTKQQEIDAIKTFAAQFDNNTYIGPWLREVLPAIEGDIKNDFPINVSTIGKLRDELIFIQREIDQKREKANAEIVELHKRARKEILNIKELQLQQMKKDMDLRLCEINNELQSIAYAKTV